MLYHVICSGFPLVLWRKCLLGWWIIPGLFSKAERERSTMIALQDFYCRIFFFFAFIEILPLYHLPSPSWPGTWQWRSFPRAVQHGLLVSESGQHFWFSTLWKICMSWHPISVGWGNKPFPSNFICVSNSMKTVWPVILGNRAETRIFLNLFPNLSPWELLSAFNILLVF